jgi:S-DNA-T family DNA segregation ATPase FtsK/SpoIIIE
VCVLVDDADRFDDRDGRLAALLEAGARVAAAGRADGLRGQFGHWTRAVRASRVGLLLHPDTDLDGELLGVRLPRRADVPLRPGRGYLVEAGRPALVQVARPTDLPPGTVRCT